MTDLRANPLTPANKGSFAYETLKDRLPVIVTKIIDYIHRDREEIARVFGKEALEDIKLATGRLAQLKNDMQTDKPFIPLEGDDEEVETWNNYLNTQATLTGKMPTWYSASWLYLECYMYRRIYQAFISSPTLLSFDYFMNQKQNAFTSSLDAMSVLASHLLDEISFKSQNQDIQQSFSQFLQVSLWSNRCDLSISAGAENAQKENPIDVLEKFETNILVNDISKIWKYIQDFMAQKNGKLEIAFVLDNAGFELFCDLCLAYFLISKDLVQSVVFYVKSIPWYISDTTENDFLWTLNFLKDMDSKNKTLSTLGNIWLRLLNEQKWQIHVEKYWTYPFDYADMKNRDPLLYRKLGNFDLVIFKGDLNYRKLVGDRDWYPITTFGDALRGFTPTPLCSLRTLKADVVVGLEVGQAETVANLSKTWMTSGEFAVIQFLNRRDFIN